ncbi:MAG: hypothetical protein KTR14_07255 [Vampirovibrio sp.]|nr:hypothetical protein [Vampirovibrio sp.]
MMYPPIPHPAQQGGVYPPYQPMSRVSQVGHTSRHSTSSRAAIPATSSAVNINIIEPKNFNGVADPGQMNTNPSQDESSSFVQRTTPAPFVGPSAPFSNPTTLPSVGPTQTSTMPGQAISQPPSQTATFSPGMTPQNSLENAYLQALNERNQAEQARNEYLSLANQLNNQAAFQQQMTPTPPVMPQTAAPFQTNMMAPQGFGYPPAPAPMPVGYNPAMLQQGSQPPFQPQQFQQPFAPPPGQPVMAQPPVPPGQMLPGQSQPGPMPPNQFSPDQIAPQGQQAEVFRFQNMPVQQLNQILEAPQTLQDKADAMIAIANSGTGDQKTYDLLLKEAMTDTSSVAQDPVLLDDANYLRQLALQTLGILNRGQLESGAPFALQELPGYTPDRARYGGKGFLGLGGGKSMAEAILLNPQLDEQVKIGQLHKMMAEDLLNKVSPVEVKKIETVLNKAKDLPGSDQMKQLIDAVLNRQSLQLGSAGQQATPGAGFEAAAGFGPAGNPMMDNTPGAPVGFPGGPQMPPEMMAQMGPGPVPGFNPGGSPIPAGPIMAQPQQLAMNTSV